MVVLVAEAALVLEHQRRSGNTPSRFSKVVTPAAPGNNGGQGLDSPPFYGGGGGGGAGAQAGTHQAPLVVVMVEQERHQLFQVYQHLMLVAGVVALKVPGAAGTGGAGGGGDAGLETHLQVELELLILAVVAAALEIAQQAAQAAQASSS
jgi:hypothetical protein